MTLLLVVDKMLDRIRDIHDRFVIHRDLKPENFLVKDLPLQFLDPIYSTSKSKKSSADKKQQIFTNNSKMMQIDESVNESQSTINDQSLNLTQQNYSQHSVDQAKRDQEHEYIEEKYFQSQKIFIIDFGLAKFFVDQNTGYHIPQRKKTHFVGTASFSSRNSHELLEQSRRDDLESLANIMVYLKKGKLPWFGLLRKANLSRR